MISIIISSNYNTCNKLSERNSNLEYKVWQHMMVDEAVPVGSEAWLNVHGRFAWGRVLTDTQTV